LKTFKNKHNCYLVPIKKYEGKIETLTNILRKNIKNIKEEKIETLNKAARDRLQQHRKKRLKEEHRSNEFRSEAAAVDGDRR
jgi:hypothetical protein